MYILNLKLTMMDIKPSFSFFDKSRVIIPFIVEKL